MALQLKNMETIRTITQTSKNIISVKIPEYFKNRILEIIILPVSDNIDEVEFFSDDELKQLSKNDLSNFDILDEEDYSKW